MIAIKDIEMPTCCYSCRFAKFPSGWVFDNISKELFGTMASVNAMMGGKYK